MNSHQPTPLCPIVKCHEIRVVLIALGDNEMMKILDSAMNQSKSVNEILKETNITHSTGFRKIKWLLNEGLIILDKIIITPDGKKFSLYHSTLKTISIKYEYTNVIVEAEPNFDIAKKWINNNNLITSNLNLSLLAKI
jgi:predicted transcriptional regulator